MKLKLYIAENEDFNVDVLFLLQEKFEVVELSNYPLEKILNEVDIFWFRLGYKIDSEVLNFKSRCKYLVTPVTGIDHIDEKLCLKLGIKIISLRGEVEFLKNVRATAEHTIALTLALLRNIAPAINHTRNGQWNRDLFRGSEMFEKKVAIIGFGRLGKITAEYFNSFGCKVGFYDNVPKEHSFFITNYSSMKEAVEDADIISIHLPFNESTENILGKKFFSWLKQSSIIINTSRGGVLDEKYLLEALLLNKINGAAIDVLKGEPNVKQNPLIEYSSKHNNLIITPHIGGNTYESFEKTEKFLASKLLSTLQLNA